MSTKGRCAICGQAGRLTRDHVPPRGVNPPSDIDVQTLGEFVGGRSENVRTLRGQIEMPTLCYHCNSELLGQHYDPELALFANGVKVWVRSAFDHGLALPDTFTVSCRPLRIAKSVVGHLLASDPRNKRRTIPGDAPTIVMMRQFFLDPHAAVPPGMALYCWVYPSDLVVICRAVGIVRPGQAPFLFDVLKFFPVAFMVAFSSPSDSDFPPFDIPSHATLHTVVEMRLKLSRGRRTDWPEVVAGNDMILIDDKMTIVATPRTTRRIS